MAGMSTSTVPRAKPHGSVIVLTILSVLWLGWLAWYLASPDHNANGQCEGLGFGCTLTPRDLATFAGVIALAPLTGLVLFIAGSVRLVRVSGGSPRTVWDLVIWGLVVLAAAAVVAGSLRGAF